MTRLSDVIFGSSGGGSGGSVAAANVSGLAEAVDDRVGALIQDSSTVDAVYDDNGNLLTLIVKPNSVQEKVGVLKNGALIGTRQAINFVQGANATLTVVDNAGSERVDVTIAAAAGGSGGGGGLDTEAVQDVVGAMVVDTATIDATYDDNAGTVSLAVKPNTSQQKVAVQKGGTAIGTRQTINLIQGSNVTIATADNAGSDRVDITISASAAPGNAVSVSTTWNPATADPDVTLSNGNLTAATGTQTSRTWVYGTQGLSSGKAGFKLTLAGGEIGNGLLKQGATPSYAGHTGSVGLYPHTDSSSVFLGADGSFGTGHPGPTTAVYWVVDLDARKAWYSYDGTTYYGFDGNTGNPVSGTNAITVPTGTILPVLELQGAGNRSVTADFATSSWLPSGYSSWDAAATAAGGGGGGGALDAEAVQDVVGAMLVDTATIDATYDDSAGTVSLAVLPNTTQQRVGVLKSGTLIGTRKAINLIEGSNVAITLSDNTGQDRLDVTIGASGSGAQGATGAPGPAGGYWFQDRAAVAAATDIPLTIKHIETGCFDHTVSDTRGGAKYARMSGAPSAPYDTNPAFIHAAGDTNVSGGSWWQLVSTDGVVDFDALGTISSGYGNYTTGAAQNQAAWEAYHDLINYGFYSPYRTLRVQSGWYAFQKAITVTKGVVKIVGEGTQTNWQKSVWAFPLGQCGLIFHYVNTDGDSATNQVLVSPARATHSAGSMLQGIAIFSESDTNKDMRPLAHGIIMRVRVTLDNVFVGSFPCHGIYVVTSCSAATDNPKALGNGYPAGNANCFRVQNTTVQWCGGSGIRVHGPDSNAGTVINSEFNYNGWWTMEEISFLGNHWSGIHGTDNANSPYGHGYLGFYRQGVWVYYGGNTYTPRASYEFTNCPDYWQAYVDTVPGTNEQVWVLYSTGIAPNGKDWIPNQQIGYYKDGGAYYIAGVNNCSVLIGSYAEGGQGCTQIYCRQAFVAGNSLGSGYLPGMYAVMWTGNTFLGDLNISRTFYSDATTRQTLNYSLASSENNTMYFDRMSASGWSMSLKRQIEGDNLVHRAGSDTNPRNYIFALTGGNSSGLGQDGSGQAPEGGLHVFPYFALANPLSFGWQLRRQVVTKSEHLNELKLGVGDIAWYEKQDGGAGYPTDDPGALVKGGWVGRAVLTGGAANASKTWANFGQIEDLRSIGPITLSAVPAGGQTGWQTWTGSTSGIGASDELTIAMTRASVAGNDNDQHCRIEAQLQFGGVLHYNIVNTGSATLGLNQITLFLRVRK